MRIHHSSYRSGAHRTEGRGGLQPRGVDQESGELPCSGNECPGLDKAQFIGNADPTEIIEVELLLNRDVPSNLPRAHSEAPGPEATAGADPRDIAAVRRFARRRGLEVAESHAADRTVVLRGTAGKLETALGIQFGRYNDPDLGEFRGYSGAVRLPAGLAGRVEDVLGLSDRPMWKQRSVFTSKQVGPFDQASAATYYTPPQVAQLYNFPPGNGQGQTIAIVEFGGGYSPSDMQTYFENLGIAAPSVQDVSVDGAQNKPTGKSRGPDGEVCLDIQVAGSIAPGANVKVYFAPNNDRGTIDLLNRIVHDPDHPCVVSISWGANEDSWRRSTTSAVNNLFMEAAARNMTVLAASGDHGSTDGAKDGGRHVDFPASSPYATGCGGTTLQSAGGAITQETVWNGASGATGGGVSDIFPLPPWQGSAQVPPPASPSGGRGVPDVAGNADPDTGYLVRVNGKNGIMGGTSAVAPLWAGLIARINQTLGQAVGFMNPVIYTTAFSDAFHDITVGNNGAFQARPGWSPTTGLGSPRGQELLQAFQRTAIVTQIADHGARFRPHTVHRVGRSHYRRIA